MIANLRRALVATIATAALGAISAGGASAAYDHSVVEKTFSVAAPICTGSSGYITDLAVDETSQKIYAVCYNGDGNHIARLIERFNYDGTPAPFSAIEPYISGNKIIEDPAIPNGKIGPRLAVANSVANNGFLFTASGSYFNVGIFKPSGEFAGVITQPNSGTNLADNTEDVTVAPNGFVYVAAKFPGRRISKYDTAFHEVERLYRDPYYEPYFDDNGTIAVDSANSLWLEHEDSKLSKYEADQFSTNILLGTTTATSTLASVQGFPSPFYTDPLPISGGFDVDPSTDNVIVSVGGQLKTLSSGNSSEAVHEDAPAFGGSAAIVIATKDHRVFTADGQTITRYGPGNIVPDVTTPQPDIDDIGHSDATVTAHVDLAGGSPVVSCTVEYGTSAEELSSSQACSPSSFPASQDVSAALAGLTTGTTYYYRFKATNGSGSNVGIVRSVTPAFVLNVKTLAATEIEPNAAVLNGSLDPDGLPNTTYRFEYGADLNYGQQTPQQSATASIGVEPVSTAVEGLPEGRLWHYRLVASNENGTTYGPDLTFRTASVPDVTGARASEIGPDSALLQARVDPVGYETEYRFEYGTTPDYGTVIPAPGSADAKLGSGSGAIDVEQRITGLTPGFTYHFRVVATNKWGSGVSPDTTFNYSPPSCPNDHVRQVTGASYLPDCRAYELVSPRAAGAVLLFPSQEMYDTAKGEYQIAQVWALNTGLAQSPSRFSFIGGGGSIAGLDAPNGIFEILFNTYLATRTDNGWVTSVPGLHGKVAQYTGRRECSESFSVCLDHKEGVEEYGGPNPRAEEAPYFSNTNGDPIGQLPTNVDDVPGGRYFNGGQRLSGDGRHFVFSSSNVAFTSDGLMTGLGSAYDNDIGGQTVEVISKKPGGGDIEPDTGSSPIEFPALSFNGSHVLMATAGSGGRSHLYMRVDNSLTYDVARGTSAEFAGATRDGSEVMFITPEQVPGTGDTDTSADLFMWREQGDAVTLISQGNGNGNSDACAASWTVGCSVQPLNSDMKTAPLKPNVPGLDDLVAENSGDVYFLSPESLDPGKPAVPNQRNLYVYHGGSVQLVTILDPGTRINRIQISPDGDHSAFLTAAKLTSYDNRGYLQMYTYDASSGAIRCASCNPSGLPPTDNVSASQGGPFMSNDGRAFFATKDALVPRDSDGRITDVYEYVGGRPQLISAGTGSRDFTGGSRVLDFAFQPEYTGLESVSANGVDVFFSTYDTLISQDENGAFIKFYDARVGGGFNPSPELAPCAAADECHSPDLPQAAPALIGTGTNLGSGGMVQSQKKAKKKKKVKQKKRRAKHAKAGQRRHG